MQFFVITSFYKPILVQLSLKLLQNIVRKLGCSFRNGVWLAGKEKLELFFCTGFTLLSPAVVNVFLHSAAIKKSVGLAVSRVRANN
jgi:hypothetical protein